MNTQSNTSNEASAREPLSGPQLLRATRPWATEDRGRTWRLLLSTLVIYFALLAGALLAPQLWEPLVWVQPLLGIIAGLVMIRVFIFFHDHLHGAILENSRVGTFIMSLIGAHVLSVRSVWQETHDYHHRNNARMVGSGIGSFPVVSTRMWRRMDDAQRRKYLATRHPATIFLGYFTVFLIGMAIAPFRRAPKRHWAGLIALVVHLGTFVVLGLTIGWWSSFCATVLPTAVSTGLGSYLFYAQHNFPDAEFYNRREWTFHNAALRSSSMFDMPGWMHWLTGNIGYHHIHHLNHRIPFYKLPEVMNEFEEFQNVGRTSWHPRDVRACLELDIWDARQKRMVSLRDVESPGSESASVAA